MDLAHIQKTENRLPLPGEDVIESSDCLIESIWGHRLWHRQSPWLIFLEFLNVADCLAKENVSFTDDSSAPETYRCRRRLFLRHLLFRNSDLDQFASKRWSEGDFWTRWIEYFRERLPDACSSDPALLRTRFAKFTDFAAAVKLLRETMVHSTNRWTSSFVFPFGPAGLYEDLDMQLQSDRGNFGRTGELLYLMLQRSGLAAELQPLITEFLRVDTANNLLLEKLQPQPEAEQFGPRKRLGYLPYKRHPAFRRLAEDWLAISRLGLPGYDAYEHYTTLASFHVLMYHVETATTRTDETNLFFVCEVLAPRMEAVRQLSIRSFQNKVLPGLGGEFLLAILNTEFLARPRNRSIPTKTPESPRLRGFGGNQSIARRCPFGRSRELTAREASEPLVALHSRIFTFIWPNKYSPPNPGRGKDWKWIHTVGWPHRISGKRRTLYTEPERPHDSV